VTRSGPLISVDNHVPLHIPHYSPDPERTRQAIERLIEIIQPRRITAFAVGHDGRAQFPSKTFPTVPSLEFDLVGLWKEIVRAHRVEFFIYVSSLRNDVVVRTWPEFARRFSNGNTGHVIDHNSKYVETLLLPMLQEVIDRYDPDGFFFDGDFWTLHDSWHPATVSYFEAQTGLRAPTDFGHPHFAEFREFTYGSYQDYVRKLAAFFHSQRRRVNWTINGAYSFRDPSDIPEGIIRTTVDMPPFFGLVESYVEAHFAQLRSSEFDINFPRFMHPEGSNRSQSKSKVQLRQELSVAHCANSLTHFYLPMRETGDIPAHELAPLAQEVADFSVQYGPNPSELGYTLSLGAAILHSEAHARRYRDVSPIRGASIALFQGGVPHSILTDRQIGDAKHIPSIVVADTLKHSPAAIDHLERHWATDTAIFVTQTAINQDAALQQIVQRAMADSGPVTMQICSAGGEIGPAAATSLAGLQSNATPWRVLGSNDLLKCGFRGRRGRLYILGGSPFRDYNASADPIALRGIYDALVEEVAFPVRLSNKPDFVLVKFYENQEQRRMLLCMSNLAFGGPALARHCYYDRIPMTPPIRLAFTKVPSDVTQNTGEEKVGLSIQSGGVWTQPFQTYSTVEVTFASAN
jgi:hypothetical protein